MQMINYLKCKRKTDWEIAKLVGSATYAELMDAGPGLFEPFYDWRGTGESSASVSSFFDTFAFMWEGGGKDCFVNKYNIPLEFNVPTPPNLVSTILAEGDLSGSELKHLLVKACTGNCSIDPRIIPLIKSSNVYKVPVLTIDIVLFIFVVLVVIVSVFISLVLNKLFSKQFILAS